MSANVRARGYPIISIFTSSRAGVATLISCPCLPGRGCSPKDCRTFTRSCERQRKRPRLKRNEYLVRRPAAREERDRMLRQGLFDSRRFHHFFDHRRCHRLVLRIQDAFRSVAQRFLGEEDACLVAGTFVLAAV